jgi:hypothetical protein
VIVIQAIKTSGTGTAAETKKIAKGCNSVKKNDV